MGFRFQRRIKILPGLTMNLGKTGSSFSFGTRGARVTVGKNGIRKTVGIPGTGMSYTTYDKYDGNGSGQSPQAPQNNVNVGFFTKLLLSKEEKEFIEGIKLLLNGQKSEATTTLSKLPTVADACFTAGMLLADEAKYQEALAQLQNAEQHPADLGVLYAKYNIQIGLTFPVTEYLSIDVMPSLSSLRLVKAAFFRQLKQTANACNLLIELYRQDKTNLLTLISLSDLILENQNPGEKWLRTLLAMTENITNETPVHTVLLYYRAMVLSELHFYDATLDILSAISRKKTGRSPELLTAIRYAQAETYEIQGKKSQARATWEKIYAENPNDATAFQKVKDLSR